MFYLFIFFLSGNLSNSRIYQPMPFCDTIFMMSFKYLVVLFIFYPLKKRGYLSCCEN